MELSNLVTEHRYVEKLIEEIPEDAVISRMSLGYRLQDLKEEIEQLKEKPLPHIHGTISFQGKPVADHHGIGAAFGTDAFRKFETIVAAKAASYTAALSPKGKIPKQKQHCLLITGTTKGSFGFEFENFVENAEFPHSRETSSYVEDALNETLKLFDSVRGTDEELADAIFETDERVIRKTADFLKHLADSEAICGIEFGSQSFRFRDVSEVRCCFQRLRKDNIHVTDKMFRGGFVGVLPHKRVFEFLTSPEEELLSGKISPEITDPSIINTFLKKPVNITTHITQVGTSKPKYLLISFKE
jgi:hypothetical protein